METDARSVLAGEMFRRVNPDCGLKTRGREETIAALREIVAPDREARKRLEGD